MGLILLTLILLSFIDKCYDVYFKEMIKDNPEPEFLVVRLSYQQYPFQDRIFNALARSFIIYKELWNKIDIDNKIPVYNKFKEIVVMQF